jgi:hypothetical protein
VHTKYTALIKNLFQEYYKRNISAEEYRLQRRKIIQDMDMEMNGSKKIEFKHTDS